MQIKCKESTSTSRMSRFINYANDEATMLSYILIQEGFNAGKAGKFLHKFKCHSHSTGT